MRKEGGCEVFSFSLWQGPCHIPFNDAGIPTIAFLSSFGVWNIWVRKHVDYRGLCSGVHARLSYTSWVLSNILKFRKGTLVKLGYPLVDRKWVRYHLTSPNPSIHMLLYPLFRFWRYVNRCSPLVDFNTHDSYSVDGAYLRILLESITFLWKLL